MFWPQGGNPPADSPTPPAAQPCLGATYRAATPCRHRAWGCTAGDASRGARQHLRPGSPSRVAAPREGAATSRQPPPPREGAVTFHFGEGKDRTVAGAERGHPGRVLLHDEPSACRSASADRLHPGAGRGAPLGSGPGGLRRGGARAAGRSGPAPEAAGGAPVAVRLTAAAAPPSTSSPAAQPLHTRAHSLPPGGCCKLQRHVQVRSPLPPRGLTCSAPRPGTPGPAVARGRPSQPRPGSGLQQGWPSAPRSALCHHQLTGGDTGELSLRV